MDPSREQIKWKDDDRNSDVPDLTSSLAVPVLLVAHGQISKWTLHFLGFCWFSET